MSDYKQTRDAAGRVTSQYSQMLQNLDDNDLAKRLRSKVIFHTDAAVWMLEAADRIEELEAKLTKAMQVIEAYEEDEGYVPRRVVSLYEELKRQNDLDQ